jgi:hypothetical protein
MLLLLFKTIIRDKCPMAVKQVKKVFDYYEY